MKVEKYSDKYIVYIYNDDKDIKSLIKNVLFNLDKYYNISFNSYDIKAYINKYYGIILEIKEGIYECLNHVSINLKILKDTLFLYRVDDPLDYLDNEIYYYDNSFFVNPKCLNINLLENSNIVYKEDVYKIIGKGIKI